MRGKPGYEHLNEPLHILVEAELPVEIVDARLMQAHEILEDLLKPMVTFVFLFPVLPSLETLLLFVLQIVAYVYWEYAFLLYRTNLRISTRNSSYESLQCSTVHFVMKILKCPVLYPPSTTASV